LFYVVTRFSVSRCG